MDKIMICGRLAASEANPLSNKPCTLADLIVVANNVFSFILTIVFPLLIAIALFYLVYSLLINLDNPGGIAKVKSDAKSVLIGSAILLGAWSLMRIALKLMGWKGNLSKPIGAIFNQSTLASASQYTSSLFQSLINFSQSLSQSFVYLFVESAYAAPFQQPLDNPDVQSAIDSVVNALTIGMAVMLVCALVYIGFRFIAYSDNPDKLKSTKKMLLIVLISGLVIFSAKFVISTLTTSFANLEKKLDNKTENQQPNTKENKAPTDNKPVIGG